MGDNFSHILSITHAIYNPLVMCNYIPPDLVIYPVCHPSIMSCHLFIIILQESNSFVALLPLGTMERSVTFSQFNIALFKMVFNNAPPVELFMEHF